MAIGSISGQRVDLSNVSGVLPVENGGTGVTDIGDLANEIIPGGTFNFLKKRFDLTQGPYPAQTAITAENIPASLCFIAFCVRNLTTSTIGYNIRMNWGAIYFNILSIPTNTVTNFSTMEILSRGHNLNGVNNAAFYYLTTGSRLTTITKELNTTGQFKEDITVSVNNEFEYATAGYLDCIFVYV